jgi:hypothetical protein
VSEKLSANYVLGLLGAIVISSDNDQLIEAARLAINLIQEQEEQINKMRNCANCHNSMKYAKRHLMFCAKDMSLNVCENWEIEP